MATKRTPLTPEQKEKNRTELYREVAKKQTGYRARALAIFPHVCASCGREFSGLRLKELTVHHKDHNHDNNPPDGSNWELLCVYCHDHEHEKTLDAKYIQGKAVSTKLTGPGLGNPFENLGLPADDNPPD